MNAANFSMPFSASSGVWASVLVKSFGVGAYWQAGVSSRSLWNSSLVMPISTL